MALHRDRLRNLNDGALDGLHARRDQLRADVVSLVVTGYTGCGIAAAIKADQATAFNVVSDQCVAGNLSLAHELGHLFGARHDTFVDSTPTPYAHGHGYVTKTKTWRTVMAYPDACSGCPRQPFWSESEQ